MNIDEFNVYLRISFKRWAVEKRLQLATICCRLCVLRITVLELLFFPFRVDPVSLSLSLCVVASVNRLTMKNIFPSMCARTRSLQCVADHRSIISELQRCHRIDDGVFACCLLRNKLLQWLIPMVREPGLPYYLTYEVYLKVTGLVSQIIYLNSKQQTT